MREDVIKEELIKCPACNARFASSSYDQLSRQTLYEILALRAAVFVVEQNCPYQDVDGKDIEAIHLMGYEKNQLVAYARILPKGIAYKDYISIGRVVTAAAVRGKGYGHVLVKKAVEVAKATYPKNAIKISAQAHLEAFYKAHGFMPTGEAYLEDDIPTLGWC